MADLVKGSEYALRAAEILLRAAGRTLLLRLPAPAIAGDPAEQLGLATPEFQDAEISPVVVRRGKSPGLQELLVSATAINRIVGSLGYSAAKVLFAGAYGILIDGALCEVLSVAESEINGVVYLYRLSVRMPAALTL